MHYFGVLLVMCCASLAQSAEILAKKCPSDREAGSCQVMVVEDGIVKWSLEEEVGFAAPLGPELRHYRAKLGTGEAAVKELITPRGWRVVLVRGFGQALRLAGPIVFTYFFDPRGQLQLRDEGDIVIERSEIGRLFGGRTELLLLSLRGERGDSIVTRVWVLPPTGAPLLALEEGCPVETILNQPGRRGIVLSCLAKSVGEEEKLRKSVFFAWKDPPGRLLRDTSRDFRGFGDRQRNP